MGGVVTARFTVLPYRFPNMRAVRIERLVAHQPARLVALDFICWSGLVVLVTSKALASRVDNLA